MRKITGTTWAIIAGVLIVVLGVVNLIQRMHQPRYQLPGRMYQVTQIAPTQNNGGATAQNGAVQGQNPNPQQPQKTITYYVFSAKRDTGHVVVTNDKMSAEKAEKKQSQFNQFYKQQKTTGVETTYAANHHNFVVSQQQANDPASKQPVLKGTKVKVKKGKVTGKLVANNNNKIQMKKVIIKNKK